MVTAITHVDAKDDRAVFGTHCALNVSTKNLNRKGDTGQRVYWR